MLWLTLGRCADLSVHGVQSKNIYLYTLDVYISTVYIIDIKQGEMDMKRYLVQWMTNGKSYGYYFEDFADATDYAQLNGEKSKIKDMQTNEMLLAFQTKNNQRWMMTSDKRWHNFNR